MAETLQPLLSPPVILVALFGKRRVSVSLGRRRSGAGDGKGAGAVFIWQ